MQAAQGFGKRGLTQPAAVRQAAAAEAQAAPTDSPPADDAALTVFQLAARADWAQARTDRPKVKFWKQYPGMTALGAMSMVFLLITLAPLHMSLTALHWIRGGLGVSSVFGFGAKRLFRKKSSG
ncbi:MAG: hypothetical protein ACYDD1_07300 [Caulobacteraceae bacterium]